MNCRTHRISNSRIYPPLSVNIFSFLARTAAGAVYTLPNIAKLYVHQRIAGSDVFYSYAKRWAVAILRITRTELSVEYSDGAADASRPAIYVCNHLSLLDAPALIAALPGNVRILYKQEIKKMPFFGGMLARSPFIAVNRGDTREAAASFYQAVREISDGGSVLLFPEGTWSSDGNLLPFKRGALLMALRSGKPVVPVAIWGTQDALPADAYRFRGGKARVLVGTPVEIPEAPTKEDERNLAARIRTALEDLLFTLKTGAASESVSPVASGE